jgi:hypothetical protein
MRELYAKGLWVCLLGALVLAWPASAQAPRRAGSAGVTVAIPGGWHATRPNQGNVGNPLTRIVVASAPIHWNLTGACWSQVAAYTFPKNAVAIVVVEWTKPLGGMKIGSGPRRPRHFTRASLPISPAPAIECFDGPGGGAEFAEHGRSFAAYILLGPKAPVRLGDRARAVLDTLHVA